MIDLLNLSYETVHLRWDFIDFNFEN